MPPTPHDTNPNNGYDEIAPHGDELPAHRPRARPSGRKNNRPKPAITDIRVARIETVTMTTAEYENAVEALAVLINRWWQQHPEHHPPQTP